MAKKYIQVSLHFDSQYPKDFAVTLANEAKLIGNERKVFVALMEGNFSKRKIVDKYNLKSENNLYQILKKIYNKFGKLYGITYENSTWKNKDLIPFFEERLQEYEQDFLGTIKEQKIEDRLNATIQSQRNGTCIKKAHNHPYSCFGEDDLDDMATKTVNYLQKLIQDHCSSKQVSVTEKESSEISIPLLNKALAKQFSSLGSSEEEESSSIENNSSLDDLIEEDNIQELNSE